MSIAIGTFRKGVMKTLTPKQAKSGLRLVSKNTVRTNVAHAAVSLSAHTGQLLQTLAQYILGTQFSQEMKHHALHDMGNIGYDLTVLCRMLKVKMPSATKKLKLNGTRTAALLLLNSLTTDLLQVVEEGTFAGPKMTKVTKEVVLPNKGGIKEEREVEIIDTDAETAAEADRQAKIKSILAALVDVYWRLSFDMLGQPPAVAFEQKYVRLTDEYGVTLDAPETETVSA